MSKVAIVTDSNSGITQAEARELGITVMPMPFFIDEKTLYEDIDLSQEEFYKLLSEDVTISTSMPMVGNVTDTWDELLKEYDEIVHIPMSSGLSGSCQSALMLAQDYDGKVPGTMEQLLRIPGVGRKTANLLLGDLYAVPGSVVCDTHCIRICGRLGLSVGKEPEKVEMQLRKILPPEESSDFCHRIVLFGREVCTARNPKCGECPLSIWCTAI